MGDREEYLETPLPLPPSLYGRSLAHSVVRWRHNQIFSAWWVTNFSYPALLNYVRLIDLCKSNKQPDEENFPPFL